MVHRIFLLNHDFLMRVNYWLADKVASVMTDNTDIRVINIFLAFFSLHFICMMATSKISESCVIICLLGLTSVICVTLGNSECKSPLGMEDGKIKNSQINVTSFFHKAYGWTARLRRVIGGIYGAWCPNVSGGEIRGKNYDQYIQIDLLNLTKITGIATQGRNYRGGTKEVENYTISYRKCGVWYFYRGKDQAAKIFSGNTDESTVVRHELEPTIMARYIRVHPGYDKDTHVCMRLELYGCVAEEVPVSKDEKKSHQNCSGKTSHSCPTTASPVKTTTTIPQTSTKLKPGYDNETANSIAMFVGIAVTLAIVLIVLFVILIIYKRRHQASKSPISVDRVGIKNQAAEAETESPPNHNQGLDHVGPTSGRTAPCEEIQIISPSSVYEVLSRNSPDRRETTNSDRSSGYLIPANGRTSPYSVVQIVSPPFVHEMLNRNRPDGRELETANSDRSSGYVISPANGKITPYRVVQIAPPSSVHDEHNRNRPDGRELETANSDRSSGYVISPANGKITPYRIVQIAPPSSVHNDHNRNQSDGRETRNSDCSSGYEEVQILSLPGYTELDKNRADETNDHTYQKLVKRDSDYLIPTHAEAEPSCVEDGKIKTTPGYTELDNTTRVQDDSASYQKLIKK